MAKQRKSSPRASAHRKHSKTVGRTTKRAAGRASNKGRAGRAAATPAPAAPVRRTTYIEAVALYEKGLQALQRREYAQAASAFRAILSQYPEEKELHERALLYLKICERQTGPPEQPPTTIEERVNAATVAINAGNYDDALRQLEAVEREDAENDHAQYLLAALYALRGEADAALEHLSRAVALNAENRALAHRDADFESLRSLDAFRAALATPATPKRERRPPARQRSAGR